MFSIAFSMSLHKSGGSSKSLKDPPSVEEEGEKLRSYSVMREEDAFVTVTRSRSRGSRHRVVMPICRRSPKWQLVQEQHEEFCHLQVPRNRLYKLFAQRPTVSMDPGKNHLAEKNQQIPLPATNPRQTQQNVKARVLRALWHAAGLATFLLVINAVVYRKEVNDEPALHRLHPGSGHGHEHKHHLHTKEREHLFLYV
jgi:hypothetical protein